MTRDTFNALITAILMVIGLIALNPGVLRSDRQSTVNLCHLLNTCATASHPNQPKGKLDAAPQHLPPATISKPTISNIIPPTSLLAEELSPTPLLAKGVLAKGVLAKGAHLKHNPQLARVHTEPFAEP